MRLYVNIRSFFFFKHVLSTDAIQLGYTDDGHCKGQPHRNLPGPQRLQWNIPPEVHHVLKSELHIAKPCSRVKFQVLQHNLS